MRCLVDVAVLHGSLTVGQLQLTGFGVTELVDPQMINQGSVGRFLVRRGGVHGT